MAVEARCSHLRHWSSQFWKGTVRSSKKPGWRESLATRTHSSVLLQAQLLLTTQVLVLCPQEVAEIESIGLRETHVGSELYHFHLEGLTKSRRISMLGEFRICNK